MTTDMILPPHLDDSQLLHLVDRDASAWELDQWAKHALACAPCAERLATLQRRSRRLSVLLAEVQPPEELVYPSLPESRRPRPGRRASAPTASRWLRAAAIALLLLLPLVAVEPVRAWVRGWVAEGWQNVTALFGADAGDRTLVDAPRQGGATLWFTIPGDELLIEVVAEQQEGRLVLRRSSGAEGSLEMVGGETETPLVQEGRIRILNAPGSAASYLVTAPANASRVRVRIGGRPAIELRAADLVPERVLELRPGTR